MVGINCGVRHSNPTPRTDDGESFAKSRRVCNEGLDIRVSTTGRLRWEASGVFGHSLTCYQFLGILCIRKLGSSGECGSQRSMLGRQTSTLSVVPLPGLFEGRMVINAQAETLCPAYSNLSTSFQDGVTDTER